MRKLILQRLAVSVPLLVVVTAVTFVLESLVPGNTARAILGMSGTPAEYERLRAELGLSQALVVPVRALSEPPAGPRQPRLLRLYRLNLC